MTDERSRHFEQDLSAVLRQAAGDGAPASLRYRLADVTATPSLERRSLFASPLRWAAVAVAVVAVAVLAFLMIPHQNVGPTPTSSAQPTASGAPPSGSATPTGAASPTATPSASLSPTPAPTAAPAAWTNLAWSKAVAMPDGQYLNDLVAWSDGFVGVGGIDDGSGFDPAFFTSRDGTHWTLVKRLPVTKTEELAGVLAAHVIRVGSRLLAVGGAVMNSPGVLPDFAAPVWASTDGRTWSQVNSPTWNAAAIWPAWLLSGPGGIVAAQGGTDPVVLASKDGSAWTRASLPAAEKVIAKDATASSNGFVIVGRDGQPDSACCAIENTPPPPGVGRPAAWISSDGTHWSEATVEGSTAAGAELRHLLPVRSGFFAVGVNSTADFYDGTLTIWTSADGQRWSIPANARWPLGTSGYPTLAADGEHAFVLDWAPEGSGLAAWVTSDGVSWMRLDFASAANAPVIDCASNPDCVGIDQAWLVPNGAIVSGRSSGDGSQHLWLAAPGH